MARIVAASDVTFYADPLHGLSTNDGLSAACPLPEIQDAIDRLYSGYDLDGQYSATINAAAGTYAKGLSLSGLLRGQRTPGNLKVVGAGVTSTIVAPTGAVAGTEINYGAAVTLDQIGFDMTNSNQDAIITGKGANFSLGSVRFVGIHPGHNYITEAEDCHMTVTGNLWAASDAQCFLQMDQFSTAYWNTNGVPNLICMWLDTTALGRKPYWADAFLDVADSNCNIQNVDYNAWNGSYAGTGPSNASGYRVRIRSGGVVNLNGLGVSSLPGSADYANASWVQGYVL
jgi:hypothetical protein